MRQASKQVFDSAFKRLYLPADDYRYWRKDSDESCEQLVAWIAGILWRDEPWVDHLTDLIVSAEYNAQATLSVVHAILMACGKHIAINYAMCVNPFATNLVKTTQVHSL